MPMLEFLLINLVGYLLLPLFVVALLFGLAGVSPDLVVRSATSVLALVIAGFFDLLKFLVSGLFKALRFILFPSSRRTK
jgi:hypothetical protein